VAGLAAFLAVSVVVIITPGQDTALTIRSALVGGRRAGIFTALGVSTGQACWTVAASAGVVALLQASEPAFLALKLAGVAYLVYIGVQALRAALRGVPDPLLDARESGLRSVTAFRQGLLSNLGNPKMAVFFTSLLPQFAGQGSFFGLLALGLLFCSLTLAWLSAYAMAVARAGEVLRRTRVRRALEAVTGTVLVALGLRLAAEQR
jgi:threonine/homoserine/homoserine lactone efflux protein